MSRTNNATAYAETIKKRVAEVVKPQLLAFSILSMQYVLFINAIRSINVKAIHSINVNTIRPFGQQHGFI